MLSVAKISAVISLVAAMMWAGSLDFEDAIAEELHYCSEVLLWKTSSLENRRFGHPDYRGIYEEVCRGYENG